MNTIKNRLIVWSMLLLGSVFTLSSCSDDDETSNSPYLGTDAHIVSLTLTTPNGMIYRAAIADETLTVYIPSNVSLYGATASYEIGEQVTIIPDPASIIDWDEEQLFRLVSYSGEVIENYTYTIVREDVQSEGSVTLTTQAELDAFAAQEYSVISGNLVLGSVNEVDDPIVNTTPLSTLTQIKGDLIVLSSYQAGNLSGLSNVTELGGIMIGTEDNVASIITDINLSLPAVTQIGDVLIYSNSVKKLELPSITGASRIVVCSTSLAETDFSSLTACAGDFQFGFSSSSNKNGELTELLCPNLTEVSGNFIIQYMTALERTDFKALKKIGANCKYLNLDALNEVNMPSLSDFNGELELTSLIATTQIAIPVISTVSKFTLSGTTTDWATQSLDFSSLESVGGAFSLQGKLSNLTELSFPALKSINGAATFNNLSNVETLDLPNFTSTTGNLAMTFPSLVELDLPSLTTSSSITFTVAAMRTLNIPVLTSFVGITFSGLTLEELRFPDSMKSFPGTLTIQSNTTLKKIYGPSVYESTVSLALTNNSTIPIPCFETDSDDGLVTVKDLTFSGTYYYDLELKGVKEITGTLTLPAADTSVLTDTETIGTIKISNSGNRVSLLSAPKLERITGDINIQYYGVGRFDLPSLRTIGGSLSLKSTTYYKNETLTNLNDFELLESVGGVVIEYHSVLTDFSGLKNAINNSTSWSVSNCAYNPTLEDMLAGRYTEE